MLTFKFYRLLAYSCALKVVRYQVITSLKSFFFSFFHVIEMLEIEADRDSLT